MSEIQKRGQLTERIKVASKKLLGYEISQEELRLIPYLQYVILNNRVIYKRKITDSEDDILRKWETSGYIQSPYSRLDMTKKFWKAINEILFLGYVDIGEE